MDKIEITPKGVCSRKIVVEVEDGIIQNVTFLGGCPGNTLGVSSLLKGMSVDEAISKLEGIKCGFKSTSCPNELAMGIKEYYKK
jgi:uncharacterized protein (TIGR03905 family)